MIAIGITNRIRSGVLGRLIDDRGRSDPVDDEPMDTPRFRAAYELS
jgi:hypothetical protein